MACDELNVGLSIRWSERILRCPSWAGNWLRSRHDNCSRFSNILVHACAFLLRWFCCDSPRPTCPRPLANPDGKSIRPCGKKKDQLRRKHIAGAAESREIPNRTRVSWLTIVSAVDAAKNLYHKPPKIVTSVCPIGPKSENNCTEAFFRLCQRRKKVSKRPMSAKVLEEKLIWIQRKKEFWKYNQNWFSSFSTSQITN